MEDRAELLGGSAQPGAGGDRQRNSGPGGSRAVPGGVSYIDKALGRRAVTGETEARLQRNHQGLKLAAHHAAIRAEVARRPDATLNELRAWLLATHGVAASLGLMHRTLARLGLTLKKSRSAPRSRTGPSSLGNARTGAPGKPG